MSKKRLLAIVIWFATLAPTGAIADVTHTILNAANSGVAAQREAEEAMNRRLLEQLRTIKIPLSQAVAIASIYMTVQGPPTLAWRYPVRRFIEFGR